MKVKSKNSIMKKLNWIFKRTRLNKNKSTKLGEKIKPGKNDEPNKTLGNVPAIVISLREEVDDGI